MTACCPGPDAAWEQRRRLRPVAFYVLCELIDLGDRPVTTSRVLAAQTGLGRDAVRVALRELESAGLIARATARDDGGRFGPCAYVVHPAPAATRPAPENPRTVARGARSRRAPARSAAVQLDQLSLLNADASAP